LTLSKISLGNTRITCPEVARTLQEATESMQLDASDTQALHCTTYSVYMSLTRSLSTLCQKKRTNFETV